MFDRNSAIRSLATKAAVGMALVASLAVAACNSTTTTTNTPTNTPAQTLTSCTATSADLTTTGGGTGNGGTVDSSLAGKTIKIDGSSALQPLFNQAANEFQHAQNATVAVSGGGSGKGLTDVSGGAVDIGMSDLYAADKAGINPSILTDHQVAVVAFTLVTNNDLQGHVGNLTKAQIKSIYTGAYTNWNQLGGPTEPITVINRPSGSGTRATFKKYVLDNTAETAGTELTQDSTGAVADAIKATHGSIGYVAAGFVTGDRKGDMSPICIDGNKATATDINSGKYQFWAVEHAYTKGPATGLAKAFLQYTLSSECQTKDLPNNNFYQLSAISADARTAHTPAGAPAPETF